MSANKKNPLLKDILSLFNIEALFDTPEVRKLLDSLCEKLQIDEDSKEWDILIDLLSLRSELAFGCGVGFAFQIIHESKSVFHLF